MRVRDLKAILEALPDELPVSTHYDSWCGGGEVNVDNLAIVDANEDGIFHLVISAQNHFEEEFYYGPPSCAGTKRKGVMLTTLLQRGSWHLLRTLDKKNNDPFEVMRGVTDWHYAFEQGKKEANEEANKEKKKTKEE